MQISCGVLWSVANWLFMYADDHQLFSAAKTTNEAGSILTAEGKQHIWVV